MMPQSAPEMPADRDDASALQSVRLRERQRIEAIRANDVETMTSIIDDRFLHINSSGKIYDKEAYVRAVRTHQLTYSDDVELTETDYRVDGDLVIIAGKMLGHARLDGEQQVYDLRSMRLWRRRDSGWKLLAWQSSALW
jgi:hypothetical protein